MFHQYKSIMEELEEYSSIISDKSEDPEMIKMAKEDFQLSLKNLEELNEEVTDILVPTNEMDEKNAILEIRAAMGGSEASLFSDDLVNMYRNLCTIYGWRW